MAHITAQALLLTYQGHITLDEFTALDYWDNVREFSWCLETAGRDHTHVFAVLKTKPNYVDATVFEVSDHKPHIAPSSARGRSARRGQDRGHFYVYNPFKSTHVQSDANYKPLRDYAVDSSWIMTLWRQSKIDDPVRCATAYRVLTPHMEAQVALVQRRQSEDARKMVLDQRAKELVKKRQHFEAYPEVETWKETFKQVAHRYKFLWISGPSGLGKTQYALAIGIHPHLHAAGVDWAGYDPNRNDVVIFDDVYDVETYINMHKPIFQAARVTTINTSKTNCFAKTVDTAGKMIIVCDNAEPRTSWVVANTVHLHVTDPMFTKHLRLCNYGENDDE